MSDAAADAAQVALDAAKTRVSGISDALSNITTIAKFDETKGLSVDFSRGGAERSLRFRRTRGRITGLHYARIGKSWPHRFIQKNMMLIDGVAGVPARTTPQIRQVGLLALIRNRASLLKANPLA